MYYLEPRGISVDSFSMFNLFANCLVDVFNAFRSGSCQTHSKIVFRPHSKINVRKTFSRNAWHPFATVYAKKSLGWRIKNV